MYYLAIDQGTTGTTAMLVNSKDLSVKAKINHEFKQHYPTPGWVEHDLNDIWQTVERCIQDILKSNQINNNEISAIGITNQRETVCAFAKDSTPLSKAIVWQDRRTHERCKQLNKEDIKSRTGLPNDPYFSGSKIEWLIQNNEPVSQAVKSQDCLFGTIDTFLIYKLTGTKVHATEPSNASRTLLYNINDGQWDPTLLDTFSIPRETLPEIQDSFSFFGKTKDLGFLPNDIPITGCLGDQQAALFGQACFEQGDSKCTYGTGAFFLMNTGKEKVFSQNGLLTTVAYQYKKQVMYALEGSSYIAGAAVQWLRDNLNFIESSSGVEELARQTTLEKVEHILFLPFFTGIASPYWQANARATITGLTRDSGPAEIAKACLEGICFSIDDLLKSCAADSNLALSKLKVDGGACANNLLMNIQATISDLEIIRPQIIETTAYGAALAAAIGSQDYNIGDLVNFWSVDTVFKANQSEKGYYQKKKNYWDETIRRVYL